jgi:hypothetical protein
MMQNIAVGASAKETLLATLGGLPLTGQGFNANYLASLVSLKRQRLAKSSRPAVDFIAPRAAHDVYRQCAREAVDVPDFSELSTDQQAEVTSALARITDLFPEWALCFSVPVEVRLSDTILSWTSSFVPQQIMLGPRAFADNSLLEELLIHEYSHVWMGFIREIADMHDYRNPGVFVLPSGTRGKDARGVIFAGMFATSVCIYLERKLKYSIATEREMFRLEPLHSYRLGCIEMLDGSPHLNALGRDIVSRMKSCLEVTHYPVNSDI